MGKIAVHCLSICRACEIEQNNIGSGMQIYVRGSVTFGIGYDFLGVLQGLFSEDILTEAEKCLLFCLAELVIHLLELFSGRQHRV